MELGIVWKKGSMWNIALKKFRSFPGATRTLDQSSMILESRFGAGPPIQDLVLHRVDKNLVATWSSPDFSSYHLQKEVMDDWMKTIQYHVTIIHDNNNEELVTKQCCCLIKCSDCFDEYGVTVTWSIAGSTLFSSIPKITSEKRSVCKYCDTELYPWFIVSNSLFNVYWNIKRVFTMSRAIEQHIL